MATSIETYPRVIPLGETAFTVEFGNLVNATLNARVHYLDAKLIEQSICGIIETVPTYRSLLVIYDTRICNPDDLKAQLIKLSVEIQENSLTYLPPGKEIEIPIKYGGEWGPDFADVAAYTYLSRDELIIKHTSPIYQVAMLGFAPGFTYLIGLPPELATPRLETPRIHIPPGSVGIAGSQTGLYALDTPGGWRIIGRTIVRLFDPDREQPFMLQAGDRVKFIAED